MLKAELANAEARLSEAASEAKAAQPAQAAAQHGAQHAPNIASAFGSYEKWANQRDLHGGLANGKAPVEVLPNAGLRNGAFDEHGLESEGSAKHPVAQDREATSAWEAQHNALREAAEARLAWIHSEVEQLEGVAEARIDRIHSELEQHNAMECTQAIHPIAAPVEPSARHSTPQLVCYDEANMVAEMRKKTSISLTSQPAELAAHRSILQLVHHSVQHDEADISAEEQRKRSSHLTAQPAQSTAQERKNPTEINLAEAAESKAALEPPATRSSRRSMDQFVHSGPHDEPRTSTRSQKPESLDEAEERVQAAKAKLRRSLEQTSRHGSYDSDMLEGDTEQPGHANTSDEAQALLDADKTHFHRSLEKPGQDASNAPVRRNDELQPGLAEDHGTYANHTFGKELLQQRSRELEPRPPEAPWPTISDNTSAWQGDVETRSWASLSETDRPFSENQLLGSSPGKAERPKRSDSGGSRTLSIVVDLGELERKSEKEIQVSSVVMKSQRVLDGRQQPRQQGSGVAPSIEDRHSQSSHDEVSSSDNNSGSEMWEDKHRTRDSQVSTAHLSSLRSAEEHVQPQEQMSQAEDVEPTQDDQARITVDLTDVLSKSASPANRSPHESDEEALEIPPTFGLDFSTSLRDRSLSSFLRISPMDSE
eukprot:gnl/TRDRNA2_/TRDRNA2_162735_c2_seq1.p1 gnl/TRDRNA2_/TRDRNA2_162735_c2~~gnl/TRDRNA2_/TRDRNA2_162735_c2_seq1.p1  ORF type:complete len:653 (-),score=128.62 gnl/TRDRNA2_/TRDRNA2_162735_c2_seq1:96-2054(-)